jgi:ABC-type transport system involved in multi-copper enzyme maturation permease subunit
MLADLRPAFIVTRREVRDQFRDWRIIFPVVILTLIFPALMNFTASQLVGFVERHGASVVGERLIPFLLMIVGFFPISVSLVIALESFVGEKERRSIEPLLSSPLSDGQVYLGKLLAAMVPPLVGSYLGIGVYLIGVYRQVGWQPPPVLLIQILLLTTVQAVVMVSGAVVVSSQTTSVRAANLLASFIIIPMALLIQGESIVMFWARYDVLWLAIFGQIVIAGLLIRTGVAHFNREELLGRELDTLNLKAGWRVFIKAFTGQAHSPLQWYRLEVTSTLRRLLIPVGMMLLALILAAWAGIKEASQFALPSEMVNLNHLNGGFLQGLEAISFFSPSSVGIVWLHNLRAILLATLAGIFSFGVLGIIILMLPLALISYIMANVAAAGFSPGLFFASLILPHGMLEIPAMILAGAAILGLGGTLAVPAHDRTIGEAWLHALADWAKIMVGLVIPLLLGAALIEVLVTPRWAILLLGG